MLLYLYLCVFVNDVVHVIGVFLLMMLCMLLLYFIHVVLHVVVIFFN